MLLLVVALGAGILIAIVLIYKYIKTPKYDAVKFSTHCKICGQKISGFSCTRCAEKKYDL